MVVQHNLTAMNANRMLGVTTGQQAKSSEKLSSGYKINRAADDAAGLTISEKMRKQIRGLDQASANAQDGVSCVQTAEGALTEVHSMLQRMNELAVQSANGTNSQSDRDAIQAEIKQLETEIDRVAETTKFNETYLLKGDASKGTKDVYTYRDDMPVAASFVGKGTTNDYSKFYAAGSRTAYANEAALLQDLAAGKTIYKSQVTTQTTGTATAGTDFSVTKTATSSNAGVTVGDVSTIPADVYKYDGTNMNWKGNNGNGSVNPAIAAAITGTPVNGDTITVAVTGVTHAGNLYAADGLTALTDAEIVAALNKATPDTLYTVAATQTEAVDGTDYAYTPAGTAKAQLYDKDGKEVTAEKISEIIDAGEKLYADKNQVTEVTEADLATYTTKVEITADLELRLHVGADSDDKNKISVKIQTMSAAGIGVNGLKVDSEDDATAAIDTIAAAIAKVSAQRSALGAVQNRLEHTIANLDNVVENTTAAESRIRDTDMAEEMVEYSKNNILAQAGQSMLAQANQATQGVLSLLQ